MDRVLAVTSDGRVFYFEPPSERLVAVEHRSLKSSAKPISRAAACDWCLWAVNCDFEVYLYVHARPQPIQALEAVFEDQKRYAGASSRPAEYSSHLLRLHEDQESGGRAGFDQAELPSENWEWQGGWHVDTTNTDADGWTYAVSFSKAFKPQSKWYDFARRRKWIRKRLFVAYDCYIKIPHPPGCFFVNQIAVGGWTLNAGLKGSISVWIVSNNGNVFFRDQVSFENPEGASWRQVELPDALTASTLACAADGSLFVATHESVLLYRQGITARQPWGAKWLLFNAPYRGCDLIQITAGSGSGGGSGFVYALDKSQSVYLCREVGPESMSLHWTKVLKGLASISLSLSNQLWTVDASRKSCSIGSNLHAAESKPVRMHSFQSPVELDCIVASIAWDQLDDLATLRF